MTHGIDLTGVSFSYPGTERVLDDIALRPPGSVVAIVGENGAGKSTLIKLLTKMYEPSSGQVLIDGQPLRRIPTDECSGSPGPSRTSTASNHRAAQRGTG